MLEGEGTRAGNVKAVAKQAGIAAKDHPVPFRLRPSPTVPPPPPREFTLKERTPWDFVITWKAPKLGASDSPILCYAIDLAPVNAAGTFGTFREIWQVRRAPSLARPRTPSRATISLKQCKALR